MPLSVSAGSRRSTVRGLISIGAVTCFAPIRAAEAGRETLSDDAAWDAIRPMMRVDTDAEFNALRSAFQAGRPGPWTDADTRAARALYDLLTQLGGEGFKAQAGPFLPEIFNDPTAADPNAG